MSEGVPVQRKVRVITKEEKEAAALEGRDAVAIAQAEENQGQSGNASAGVQVKYVTPTNPQQPQMGHTPTTPTAEQAISNSVHEPAKPELTIEQQTSPPQTSEPSEPEIPVEDEEDTLIFGHAAIKAARGIGYPYVFRASDGQQMRIEAAQQLKENEYYFDFSILENVEDLIDDEEIPLPDDVSTPTVPPPMRDSNLPGQQSFGQQVDIQPVRVQSVDGRGMPARQVLDYVQNGNQIETHANPEMQAWSGVLNFPNLEIYYHQNGILRVHVDGKINYSLRRDGNVRILRIQKKPESTTSRQTGMKVHSVVSHVQPPAIRSSLPSTNAVKPGARSPNPSVSYRYNGPPPKQPEPDIPPFEENIGDEDEYEF